MLVFEYQILKFASIETISNECKTIECKTLFYLPLPEIVKQHPRGESFTTDTDSLQHTITSELMQHEVTINHTGRLRLVRNDTTHEMGGGVSKGGQQGAQLLFVTETDCLESRTFTFASL